MITIQTLDGHRYTANTLRTAFDAIRYGAIGYHEPDGTVPTARQYMMAVARRVAEWKGVDKIDTRSVDAFVVSMIHCGQWSVVASDGAVLPFPVAVSMPQK